MRIVKGLRRIDREETGDSTVLGGWMDQIVLTKSKNALLRRLPGGCSLMSSVASDLMRSIEKAMRLKSPPFPAPHHNPMSTRQFHVFSSSSLSRTSPLLIATTLSPGREAGMFDALPRAGIASIVHLVFAVPRKPVDDLMMHLCRHIYQGRGSTWLRVIIYLSL
jgi:hypothetical protein